MPDVLRETERPPLMTVQEVARLFRVSTWTIGAMTRDGRLPRVAGLRQTRIPARAVYALMEGQTPPQAPAPRRAGRSYAERPLTREVVDGRRSLYRPIGPAPGDVVVRRVEGRSRP